METGDIVVVVKPKTLPDYCLGRYGLVVNVFVNRICVEFIKPIGERGGRIYAISPEEVKKVGEKTII